MDMHRPAVNHRTSTHGAAVERTSFSGRLHGRRAVSCDKSIAIIFHATDGDIGSSTYPSSVLSNDSKTG